MPATAEILWWVFVATVLAVVVLVGGLAIAIVIAQRRLVSVHRDYAHRLVKAHEEERIRVAREVHDDAIQRLALLGHELDIFGRSEPGLDHARVHHLQGIRSEVQDLAEALRLLAHRLHPAAIEQAGLRVALTQLAEETGRAHGLRVHLNLPEKDSTLPPDVSLALFRIVQEALRNVVRHARVNEATITLRERSRVIVMVIQDSGVGFDRDAIRTNGIGLVGIEERAGLVGGTVRILSAPGQGTHIAVRVEVGPRTE